MEEKFILLLNKQIDKIDAEEFDLEAWKGSTIALINNIYGKDNHKSEQIKGLHIDYSSWALRDATSRYNPLESCKKQGREILQLTIDEIENFGLPTGQMNPVVSFIHRIFELELKGSQLKELKNLLDKSDNKDEIIQKMVKGWGSVTNAQIVTLMVKELLNDS